MEAWLLSERILTASQAELARREGERLGLNFSEIVQRLGLVSSEGSRSFVRFVANFAPQLISFRRVKRKDSNLAYAA